ncbi:hypothetical protein HFD88_004013 [Aspergillus terreus]|nr:hypothetical protein HFD88_004013 [Aspergillus terreus]
MSLKRKASFSAINSPASPTPLPEYTFSMDDSPKHLHSRTRKRFRNDRPDEKVVYENTLRWLFTAQQNRPAQTPIGVADEQDMDSEPLPTPETLDPRQQTLHKFFQPSQPALHSRPHLTKLRPNEQSNNPFLRPPTLDINMTIAPMGSDATSSPPQESYTDMDVDMDVDSGSDEPVQAPERRVGGLSWMGHPRLP